MDSADASSILWDLGSDQLMAWFGRTDMLAFGQSDAVFLCEAGEDEDRANVMYARAHGA